MGATIAQALGLSDHGEQALEETLAAYLSTRQLLLIIDNFEHLLGGVPLISELLARSPALTILVTSRTPLHLYAEHEYLVPPLPCLIQSSYPSSNSCSR